jgi:LacI family transcriptional regulator
MGKKAFKILYKQIRDKKEKKSIVYRDEILETNLVLRESTKNQSFKN